MLFLHSVNISKEIGKKKRSPYIEEPHLSSLLTSIRADKLDKLFQRLLRVIADGWVREIRPGLLDDGRCREMKSRRCCVRACCRKRKRQSMKRKARFATASEPDSNSFFLSFLTQLTALFTWLHLTLDRSARFSSLRL